ncbi:MAG: hypothetical protein K6B44_04210 [Lachnospiraceae bacterium]|nr:hypothetical protein [Lachnospiraceae bacterium]
MKNVMVTIGATNIRSLNFSNNFTAKPGEQIQLKVNTGVGVRLNPASPTTAAVVVKFEATDGDDKNMSFEMETLTPITVSTFIDNLDEVIKKNYLNDIMMAVNEKIRIAATITGLNITTPSIAFAYRDNGEESLDSEIIAKV